MSGTAFTQLAKFAKFSNVTKVYQANLVLGLRFIIISLVDGGFGEWSKWSVCSKSCDYGRQFRFRACNKPIPKGSGKRCNDMDAVETRLCNTFQCGG